MKAPTKVRPIDLIHIGLFKAEDYGQHDDRMALLGHCGLCAERNEERRYLDVKGNEKFATVGEWFFALCEVALSHLFEEHRDLLDLQLGGK